jgi:hypothetical protein
MDRCLWGALYRLNLFCYTGRAAVAGMHDNPRESRSGVSQYRVQ